MAKQTFEGTSLESYEEAVKNAIETDPRGDERTDRFEYTVVNMTCVFGGFTHQYNYNVKLERDVQP
jgi:hypothetical protein